MFRFIKVMIARAITSRELRNSVYCTFISKNGNYSKIMQFRD